MSIIHLPATSSTAADGSISAYVAGPDDAAAGIVVVQEIFGVNAHIRSIVDRYAEIGYRAIAPAFFDRVEPGVELDYNEEGIEAGIGYATALEWSNTMADIQAAIGWLGVPSGIVGYCWGGSAAWLAASQTTVAAAVGYYGGRIPDMLSEVPSAPIVLHFGEHDASIPLEKVDQIKSAYPEVPIHVYDAEHGFNCDARASFSPSASAEALARTLELFSGYLPSV